MVFLWNLSGSKSPQVSWTPPIILAHLNNTVVWMVLVRSPISNSSSLLTKVLGTVSSAPIKIGITINFIFYSFFNSQARFRYLSLFSFSFIFNSVVRMVRQSLLFCRFSLFLFFFSLISTRCGLLGDIRWSVCIPKSQWILCVSFSRMYSGLCIYYLVVWSDFNFWHNSQWIIFLTQLCLVLYTFCANLLYLLIMWLIVSSLLPHNQHLPFCCVLSIFVKI